MHETYETEEPGQNRTGWIIAGGLLLALVVGGGYYLASGADSAEWGGSDVAVTQEEEAPVAAAEPAAEPEAQALEARGVIQASNEATLASRITARITSMPYKEGSSFGRGAVLARFDCSQMAAQLAAANAASAAYQKTYETNVELDQYEAIGTNEVAVSKANLGKAQAEAAAIRASLTDCTVRAPFAGSVVERIANPGEVAASGQPMLKIQSGGALEAELIVPSAWLTWIAPGQRFAFLIDETGEEITGTVKSLGASVDPVSKTIRVTGDVTPGGGLVLPGMSGTARFTRKEETPDDAATPSPSKDARQSGQDGG